MMDSDYEESDSDYEESDAGFGDGFDDAFDEDSDEDMHMDIDFLLEELEDSDELVRRMALQTLGRLEPARLAQYANAVVARLEDSKLSVRGAALETLGALEPGTFAQHAHAVVAMLDEPFLCVRYKAVQTLGKLEAATLAQYANAVLNLLENPHLVRVDGTLTTNVPTTVSAQAERTLLGLPRFVTHGVDFFAPDLRSRLLGRVGWYKCRLILRVKSHTLYWYALPYRPSGPGHARDVEAWNLMNIS